jgi:DNA oxidative demethylase
MAEKAHGCCVKHIGIDMMQHQKALFDDAQPAALPEGVALLRGFFESAQIWPLVQAVLVVAPLRHYQTPGGQRMSVAMSACGPLGWISDRAGYRYSPVDPASGAAWPAMPQELLQLAVRAARLAGFADFNPDACLINCYTPAARMGLHQDRDEKDFTQPIVSLSLGMPAVFLLGGLKRSDKAQPLPLHDGDALVFGGPARLCHHGVRPLRGAADPLLGEQRINLTFRRAA